VELLDANADAGIKVLMSVLNRSATAIRNKARALGVTIANLRYMVPEDDDQWLREHYTTATWDEMFERFPRWTNRHAITSRANSLNLRRR